MWIYVIAGLFLLVAIVFVIKFFVDGNRKTTVQKESLGENGDITVLTEKERQGLLGKKSKKDIIIALVLMALCEACILLGKYVTKEPINIFIPKPFKKKLWNESLRGGIQFSEEGVMKFEDYFKELPIKKIQSKPFDIFHASLGTLDLKLFRTRHVTTRFNSLRNSQVSYGVLIDERVIFTADTQFNEPQLRFLLNKYKTIEYIFHDCDVSGYSAGVHASYDQLCTLPPEIRSKTYLCHYNEAVNEIEALVDGFAGLAKPGVYYNI